jgi:hypothetical protein
MGQGILASHPKSDWARDVMTRESEGSVPGQQQAIGLSFSPDAPLSTRVPSR